MPRIDQQDVEKMKKLGDVKGLIKALGYKNSVYDAVKALGQIGDVHAVEQLIVALKDED